MEKATFTFLKAFMVMLATFAFGLQLNAQFCGDAGLSFEQAVSKAKNCDGSISIMWLELTDGADAAGHTYGVTIYKVTNQGNVEVLDFDNLTDRSILLQEGALEINQEYIMSLNEFCNDGATTQRTGQIFNGFPDNVENAEPTFSVVSTKGPECSNDDRGNDKFNGSVTFQIDRPTYANCPNATFRVFHNNQAFEINEALNGATNFGRFGFDEDITITGLGTGPVYIALSGVQNGGNCDFQVGACLQKSKLLTTLAVEDTKAPELTVVIEDDALGTRVENQGGETTYDLGVLDPGEDCCFTVDFGAFATDNCDGDPNITVSTTGSVTYIFNPGPDSQPVGNNTLTDFRADGVATVVFCAGDSGEGSVTFTSTDENGNESKVTFTATVPISRPTTDMAPATYYVAPCEEGADVIYGFTATDRCNLDAFEALTVLITTEFGDLDGFPITLIADDLYVEARGENGLYIEFFIADVPPGLYLVTSLFDEFETSAVISVEELTTPNLENLACNDNVNVNLNEDCEAVVTADMVLEGDNICNDLFTVVVDYGMGDKSRDIINRCGTFPYEVFTLDGESICWGYITGEDKDGPRVPEDKEVYVACTDLDEILAVSQRDATRGADCEFVRNNPEFGYTSWDLLYEKCEGFDLNDEVYDNCSEFCHLEFQITDLLMEGDICSNGSMIVRTIKVTDEKGNSSSFIIRFIAKQPRLELEDLPEELSVDLCTTSGLNAGAPFYVPCWKVELDNNNDGKKDAFATQKIFPDFGGTNSASFCGYAVSFEDTVLPFECDGEKIIRNWTIMDWCKDPFEVSNFQQVLKKGFFAPAKVECNPMLPEVVSTGAFDCTATLVVPAPIVTTCKGGFEYTIKIFELVPEVDDFGIETGETVRQLGIYPIREGADGRYVVSELPIGDYEVEYFVTTECGAVSEPIACPFSVRDLTEPVAVCDDELNVSLGGEGIARVTVNDVDEGSWDNCELVDLKIRRSLDSCLDDYLNEVLGVSSLSDLKVNDAGTVWSRLDETGVKYEVVVVLEGGSYFTGWADAVYFLCCDISKSQDDFVVVELQATDKAGNTNKCWMDILVENKLTPRCVAPAPAAFNCWDFTLDGNDIEQVRAQFGTVEELLASKALQVDFNCEYEVSDALEFTAGDCSEGELKRTFTVTAPSTKGLMSSTCTQLITIETINDYLIKFPGDAEDFCGGDGGELLETKSYTCDILAVDADTAVFVASGDECFKRFVTYRVINWCEYDGISLEPSIIPRDVDCDGDFAEYTYVKSTEGDVWVDDDNSIDVKGPIGAGNEFVLSWSAEDDYYYSLGCDDKKYWYTPGYFEYTQVIKVYDNEAPIVELPELEPFCAFGETGAAQCNGEVMIMFSVSDICTEEVEVRTVQLAVNSANPTNFTGELYNWEENGGEVMITSIAGLGLPVGTHYFLVKVADDCGNIAVREIPFSIEDCKTPAPVCISILSVDLMPIVENKEIVGGMNVVWAVDFIASDIFDVCSPHPNPDLGGDVRYYAVRADEVAAAGLEQPDSRYLSEDYRDVEFTCADNGSAVTVFVIAVDGVGNFDYCTVMVNVQPGADPNPCDGGTVEETAAVAGLINTEESNAVAGVEIALSGQSSGSMMTSDDGNYLFGELIVGYDYSIAPLLDANHLNGVSTFDLVLISKHILGVESLASPYKLIAADVNNSASVTTMDLIQLRKMILSIDDEFANNTSWKFVPTSYEFANPSNPWAEDFPQVINLNNLSDDMMSGDFVAIKIGDVNGNAIANSSMSVERNVTGNFAITTSDVAMVAGNEYTVQFTAADLANIAGYQFTLNFTDAVELVGMDYGVATEENFGMTHVAEGVITTSWNGAAEAGELFTVVFRANSDVNLSEVISLGSRYTAAEAYSTNDEAMTVGLSFGTDAVANAGFEVYQNTPNPFVGETLIGFTLPTASEVTITINNVNGQTLSVLNGNFGAGYNNITINANDIPATGILYYTVETADFTVTKKMVKLK